MKFSSLSIALLALLGADSALAEAGRFQFVHGDVFVVHPNGSQTAARKGDNVEEGDTIATGAFAQAQLVMKDEGLIALRPDSRLRIDVYRVTGKADGAEQGVFGLLRGGFRSITGWIGRINKDNYKVHTATATIGIRGTDHESMYIAPPLPGETPLGPPGTYDKVNSGQTYLETSAGRVELDANQVGFVPAIGNTPPVRLQTMPSFLKATPGIQAHTKGEPKTRNEPESARTDSPDRNKNSASDNPPENRPTVRQTNGGLTAPPLAVGIMSAPATAQLPPSLSETFNSVTSISTGVLAPNGTAVAGGGMGSAGLNNGAGFIGDPSGNLSVMLDASGGPVTVTGNNFNYIRNGAPALMQDSQPFGTETVKWGIYDGGVMVDNGVASTKTIFFWMDATSATTTANLLSAIPTIGATLSFTGTAGFTPPITESAGIGGTVMSSVSLQNFDGTPFVSSYNLKVMDTSARTWMASLTAPQSLDSFRTGGNVASAATINTSGTWVNNTGTGGIGNLSGTCTGCSLTAVIPLAGNVQGVVIGNPTPVGMLSSYKMNAGTSTVAGAVVTR
jgi:hypothetical protein